MIRLGHWQLSIINCTLSILMMTLFIDLCSHRKIIACVGEEKTIALTDIPDHTDEAGLMPAIERLLSSIPVAHRSGRSISSADGQSIFSRIDRIAAITGPGGFMSQRVELSLANTLSWTLKIPIAGIHLSEVWKARVSPITDIPLSGSLERGALQGGVRTVWLHSTQKSALFIRGFGAFAQEWSEATLISLDDAKQKISKESLIVGELIPEHRAYFSLVPDTELRSAERVLPELCKKASEGRPPMLPWYGRGI